MEQIKSRERVVKHGEVFTAEREVKAMLDLVKKETQKIGSTFFEPACGCGAFLKEILERKMDAVVKIGKKNFEKNSVQAVSSIYGIDIMQDNVDYCRTLLYGIWMGRYRAYCGNEPSEKCQSAVKYILDRNIVCGDTLERRYVTGFDENEKPKYDGWIVFSEWKFHNGTDTISRSDCYLDDMIEDDDKKKNHPNEDLPTVQTGLWSDNELEELCGPKPDDVKHMKFDVIISNPPYQLNDGGHGASAKPIYHLFIEQAKKLNPKYISMIVPARWYAGGKGLDSFRDNMLKDNRITELHDYVSASDCFSGVEIKGGVCYFLWDKNAKSDCNIITHKGNNVISSMKRPLLEKGNDTFIRYNDAIQIIRKIKQFGEPTFDFLVSPRKPFGFPSNFRDYKKTVTGNNSIFIYAQKDTGYVTKQQIEKNVDCINKWKVFIPEAIGAGNMEIDIVKPILGTPNTVCSETYVMVGPLESEVIAKNVIRYINTRFFHFLLGLKKITQHTTSKTYSFIPQQDFKLAWNDEMLYKKYKLSNAEIEFINNSVLPEKNLENN